MNESPGPPLHTQSGVSTPPGKAAHADPTPIRLLDPTVFEAIADPGRYRPDHCPQCEAQQPLAGQVSINARWWTWPSMA